MLYSIHGVRYRDIWNTVPRILMLIPLVACNVTYGVLHVHSCISLRRL